MPTDVLSLKEEEDPSFPNLVKYINLTGSYLRPLSHA